MVTTFSRSHFRILAFPIGDRIVGAQAAILIVALCTCFIAALFTEWRQHARVLRQHTSMLEESQTLLHEALAAGAVMAFECNLITGLAQRSENGAQIIGLGPQQTLTATLFLAQIHSDDQARFKEHHRRAHVDIPATVTFRFIRSDGREVWLEETSRVECDTDGRLVRVKGLIRDITERKQAEKREDLLSAELDHRVKNVLARVAAVLRHTQRRDGSTDEFVKAVNGRIQSIAAAHALLSQSRWSGVGLTDLIRYQLAPYATDANTAITGPDVMLSSAQTQAVAMAIHELATNAAKHGALSSPDGRVSVSWDRTGADASAVLTMIWRELGGPPITTPVQSGYGLSLIRDLIPHELGGTVNLKFPSDGACCTIEIPLDEC
jgi:PAS domain S-box-containing protein